MDVYDIYSVSAYLCIYIGVRTSKDQARPTLSAIELDRRLQG